MAFLTRLVLFVVLSLLSANTFATHIVGGELQMNRIGNERYEIVLTLYFDLINGNLSAIDNEITVWTYTKSGNRAVESFSLPLTTFDQVQYTNNACSNSRLSTRRYLYRATVTMRNGTYNDSNGYYMSWQRCCRNNVINNIANPGNVGSVFYLEFPRLSTTNSSPTFRNIVGDYACRNNDFTLNFAATDADGDQLRYSLVTPLAGNLTLGSAATTGSRPGPYTQISWLTGFSATNAIPGSPALQIDPSTGILRVRASTLGLFVFSVLVEEIRGGVKIGEVRRDYQILVIDCPVTNPPVLALVRNDNPSRPFVSGDTLFINQQANRCFSLQVSDPDAGTAIRFALVPVNFQLSGAPAFFSNSALTLNNPGQTGQTQFCWPPCTFVSNSQPSYIFDLVASDNSCPQPRTSTIRVVLIVRPDPNILPSITTSLGTNQVDIVVTDNLSFLINGIDLDNDDIEIEVLPRNFRLSDLNMQVADKSTGKGNLSIPFNWQTDCRAVKDINNRYIIDFIITDNKPCFNTKDTVTVEINLRDQPFNDANFLPANAFTPNRDGLNESFMINDFPDETCLFRFKKIEIYNRWGGLVFESKDKNFRWEATDFAAGQYFYSIDYGKKSYKNQLQIIK
ncbi:MAG TPA: hypothetical protein DCM08_07850 [Microscillaceae bacterium]|jgi:gliding motility-associated-like protein|nr:hypothetical protein [Microscillaceae bacterium]